MNEIIQLITLFFVGGFVSIYFSDIKKLPKRKRAEATIILCMLTILMLGFITN